MARNLLLAIEDNHNGYMHEMRDIALSFLACDEG